MEDKSTGKEPEQATLTDEQILKETVKEYYRKCLPKATDSTLSSIADGFLLGLREADIHIFGIAVQKARQSERTKIEKDKEEARECATNAENIRVSLTHGKVMCLKIYRGEDCKNTACPLNGKEK